MLDQSQGGVIQVDREPVGWRGRSGVDLLREQLDALTRWHEHRRSTEEVVELRGMNRELRLDLERRQRARGRQQDALLATAAAQLEAGHRLLSALPPRAVLVHRREWLRTRVAKALAAAGVHVVAQLEDGADAVGVAVAEQPDLLFVEDALPTMNGTEVLRAVRPFCGRTLLAVAVDNDAQVSVVRRAGAQATFTRRSSPDEIARELLALVDC